MRAGRLDTTLTIERFTYEPGEYGEPIYTWTTLATPRAQVVDTSTEEFIRAYGASSETVAVFRVRFIDGLTLADRVIANGIIHDLKDIKPIGRRRGLELRCVATGG